MCVFNYWIYTRRVVKSHHAIFLEALYPFLSRYVSLLHIASFVQRSSAPHQQLRVVFVFALTPEAVFWREASPRRWEPDATVRLHPRCIFFNENFLLLRLLCTDTLRSTYTTTPSSSRWLFIHHSIVVFDPINVSTTAKNGASSNSGNITYITLSIIVSGRHRLPWQRLLQRD